MIDEKRIAEMSLTAKALRRDARDYRERLFAVGTDKTHRQGRGRYRLSVRPPLRSYRPNITR